MLNFESSCIEDKLVKYTVSEFAIHKVTDDSSNGSTLVIPSSRATSPVA